MATTAKKTDAKQDAAAVKPVEVPAPSDTPNDYHEHAASNGCVGG